jgi:hypothetical protein
MVFVDPLFKTPLVLGTNLAAAPDVVFTLYLDRWPVEQSPLGYCQLKLKPEELRHGFPNFAERASV